MMLRKTGSAVAAVVAAAGLGFVAAPAGSAAPQDCDIRWGSGPNSTEPAVGGYLTDIRAGEKNCYDRLVFDMSGAGEHGFSVSYVDEVTQDASGDAIPVRGGARLQITVHAPAYDERSEPTYEYEDAAELVGTEGFRTFRQVVWAGSWEGTTMVGLGVRAHLPYRVFAYDDRVVVDVAHKW